MSKSVKRKNIVIKINKFLLKSVGGVFPLYRHPCGKIGNKLRCIFTSHIVAQMGKNCVIEKNAEIHEGCVIGNNTGVGPNCMVGPQTVFKGHSMMGPNVRIYTTGHAYDEENHRFDGATKIKPVILGENIWIGDGVIILPGVVIGNNTIIGAGSVVSKSIPSGVVAAGNPCVVKKILDQTIFEDGEK